MTIQIYHNSRCSKSRQTLALLEENNVTPEIVEYLKEFDYHVKFSAQGDYESWDRESQEDFLFLPGDYNDS